MRPRPVWLALLLVTGAMACAGPSSTSPPAPRRLTVFAAASLKDALAVIGEDFRAAQSARGASPVELTFSFAGSQTLRAQIEQGARADVFAAADPAPLVALRAAGRVGPATTFAQNDLVVVVPAEGTTAGPAARSPARTLEDVAGVGRWVVATPEAPLGSYTQTMFSRLEPALRAAIEARVVSRELDARQVLGRVLQREADAAVVYRSDARAAGGRVRLVEPPADARVTTTLAGAVVSGSAAPDLAAAFLTHVASPLGAARLRAAGFRVDPTSDAASGPAGP